MSPFISRVVLKNYKSIKQCDISLKSFCLLVGPNGSGKSNFLDAMRFVRDALQTNLQNAIQERGGIDEVRRRSTGHPTHFGIRLEFSIDTFNFTYAFQIAARKNGAFEVQRELCKVERDFQLFSSFDRQDDVVISRDNRLSLIPAAPNALLLPLLAGFPGYSAAVENLTAMSFYSFSPAEVRKLQNPDVGLHLFENGANIGSVVREMMDSTPKILERVESYLASVVPGIHTVRYRQYGPQSTIEFGQDVKGSSGLWKFPAASVSDGTLRALCVLIAAFQQHSPLITIEEPETAIHPGAARRLMDALLEAGEHHQLILTTHSPDLLDHPDLDGTHIIAVQSQRGATEMGPLDHASREAVRKNLYSVGELLRLEQITPDLFSSSETSVRLF
ncbi:MAG: AAA family ATPase [Pseudoclavibacter sp.]